MKQYKILMGILIPILFFNSVYSFSLTSASTDEFLVFPEKTYQDEVCINDLELNKSYIFTHSELNPVIETFYFDVDIFNNTNKKSFCNKYYFEISKNKYNNTDTLRHTIYVQEYNNDSISVRYGKYFDIDISEMTYKDLYFSLSKKFVLFFVSIYAVFATLLYIINSKKFNGEE